MKFNINCPCGSLFSAEIPEFSGLELDLDRYPQFIDEICSGDFMSFTCKNCGKKHKPEKKIILTWKSKNLILEVIPELERAGFYRRKDERSAHETIIGFPEMADRITVLRDGLEPAVIEALKYYLLVKAYENYPDNDINAWYHNADSSCVEFHLEGIQKDEVAVMKVPYDVYEKTLKDFRKNPKNELYSSLYSRSYLSVQNIFKPDGLR